MAVRGPSTTVQETAATDGRPYSWLPLIFCTLCLIVARRLLVVLNLRSVSLRFSAYLCVLCVYGCFNAEVAEVRREPQRKN